MPIEIRELVIRATITSPGEPGVRSGGDGGDAEGRANAPVDIEAIVQECVRQVMKILAQGKER